MGTGDFTIFNINDGYLEAILRGYRAAILRSPDYNNLMQCENLEDMKMHLSSTEYGDFLQNESVVTTAILNQRCLDKLVRNFTYLRAHAAEPLATFLDYITYGYMIDNIMLLITGALHERDISELIAKCHPLGMFENIGALSDKNLSELYNTVIVDTPLAPYFAKCLSEEDLDEMNSSVEVEKVRCTLFKAYLEDFYAFSQRLGHDTAEVMGHLLKIEADRRAINITLHSFGSELDKEDRKKLYPDFGYLNPEGLDRLGRAEDPEQVKAAMEFYADYRDIFAKAGYENKSIEDCFFEHEVRTNVLSFEQQFHYGIFFSYIKLKEQEIRNIVWIAECIAQDQKEKVNQQYISIFEK